MLFYINNLNISEYVLFSHVPLTNIRLLQNEFFKAIEGKNRRKSGVYM